MILSVDDLRRFDSDRLRQLETERTLSDEEWRMVVAELSRRASTPSPTVAAPPPPAPPSKVRRSAGARTFGIAAASVALVVFVLAVSRPSAAPQTAAAAAPAEPEIETTASEYFAAYQTNEIAADARFKAKALAVSAIVVSINKDFADHPYLTLDARQGFLWVQASLDRGATAAAARLAPGSVVYLHCRGGGKLGPTPFLTGCTIQ